MTIREIEYALKDKGIDSDDILWYIKTELRDEILEELGYEDVLGWLLDERSSTGIIEKLGVNEVIRGLKIGPHDISGYFVIKSENLQQTQRIQGMIDLGIL